jgi:hypothetical protein
LLLLSLLSPFFSLPKQCDLLYRNFIGLHPYFISMILIAILFLRLTLKSMRLTYFCHKFQRLWSHAIEVLKRYAPDKNQATITPYHITDHNFNLDVSHLYGRNWNMYFVLFAIINVCDVLRHRFIQQPTDTVPM